MLSSCDKNTSSHYLASSGIQGLEFIPEKGFIDKHPQDLISYLTYGLQIYKIFTNCNKSIMLLKMLQGF